MKTLASSALPVAKAPRKPVVVRVAGVESLIYANAVRVDGKSYDSFLVKFPDPLSGRQGTKRSSDLSAAKGFAEECCRLLADGQASAASLTNKDAARYGEACELLRPLGVEIHVAARAYAVKGLRRLHQRRSPVGHPFHHRHTPSLSPVHRQGLHVSAGCFRKPTPKGTFSSSPDMPRAGT